MKEKENALLRNTHREKGMLVVVALVLMSALAVMGSLAMILTVTERKISRNYKISKEAFYLSDSGHFIAVEIIENIVQGSYKEYPGFSVAAKLVNEVMNYHQESAWSGGEVNDSPENAPDIKTSLRKHTLCVDVDRIHTSLLYGGSAEFGSGAEGAGFGGIASRKILFEITSQAQTMSGGFSRVITVYRSIL
jgi:hypothetical protein